MSIIPPVEQFRCALEQFKHNAPVGSHVVDRIIEGIARRRGKSINTVELRRDLWIAALQSMLQQTHREVLPDCREEAEAYLSHLRDAAKMMRKASHADEERVCKALMFIPDDPKDLSQLLTRQMVEREFTRLNHRLAQAHKDIEEYLDRNVIAQRPQNTSNAADHFIRGFIEHSCGAWRQAFGEKLVSEDQADFVRLLASALSDFGHPVAKQSANDDWLAGRVRKQLFPPAKKNPRK
jgi:hypothetical protein